MLRLCALQTFPGKPLKGYPMALPSGAIASASVLLVDLHDYSKEARLKTSKMSRDKVLDPSMSPWMAHYYGYEPPPSRGRSTEKIALESIDANGTVHVTEVLTGSERKKSRLVRTFLLSIFCLSVSLSIYLSVCLQGCDRFLTMRTVLLLFLWPPILRWSKRRVILTCD